MARFLCDENIFPSTKELIKAYGHDVLDIKDTNLIGCSDKTVSKLARRAERIIITLDLHFANIYKFTPDKYPGIIVIRVRPAIPNKVDQALKKFLNNFDCAKLKNCLIIVEENGYRIRK